MIKFLFPLLIVFFRHIYIYAYEYTKDIMFVNSKWIEAH